MQRPARRHGRACLFIVILLSAPGFLHPGAPSGKAEALPTQLFTVRFKDVNDVYLLIEPLVSAKGSVQMQPRLKTLTVTDDEATLQKIGELIRGYDLPPKNVAVAFQ